MPNGSPGWGTAPGPYPAGQYAGPPYAGPPYTGPMPVAQKPALPRFPHPEPREYHQMLRTWNYAWWKPVVGTVLVFLGMVLVAPLVLMPVLVLGVMFEPGSFWENFQKAADLKNVGPAALLYLNLSLGASILVCWGVMRYVHRMRPRWLTSVVPKMRWKLFFICVGVSVIALIAQIVAQIIVGIVTGDQGSNTLGKPNEFTATTALLGLIVLATTPLQAAGEEYVFRGYLMQALGSFWSFSRVPAQATKWIAILGTATLFALAHGVQNFPLFFDRFMFGFIAGWLVIRTGGLEAGIALHILNNFLAFAYALTFSDLSSTLNVSEAGWENIPVTLAQAGTYAGLVLLVARKMNLQRRTAPPVEAPPAPGMSPDAHVPSPA
ncbi:MAG TPA: CPBP family intramembrane glutamic endopeptidase [Nocardioidaceae bacterium]|nr:CPBP family intramembrane glutamic endopeptidase [Nocardioidaceae bacterium]